MNEAPPLIEVQRLCKTVRDATGELPILRDVSFALAQRQTAAIVGASGSGKSTLLSLIAGLDVPSSICLRWMKTRAPPSAPGGWALCSRTSSSWAA